MSSIGVPLYMKSIVISSIGVPLYMKSIVMSSIGVPLYIKSIVMSSIGSLVTPPLRLERKGLANCLSIRRSESTDFRGKLINKFYVINVLN